MTSLLRILGGCLLLSACADTSTPGDRAPEVDDATLAPETIGYQVVKEYPHDTKAYTQGLIWYDGYLVEGTGQYGESNVRKVELATGKVVKEVANAKEIFGEGITILRGKLYQVTWQNRVGYVYDAATLRLERSFDLKTEGWGLTNNGSELILSDGSSNLYFLDPNTLQETHRVGVNDHLGPKGNLNELEFINGYVFANVWQADNILKIDPSSGRVVGVINFSDLRGKAGIPGQNLTEGGPDVLNGIAWDSANNRVFITGKYWPKLFEIRFQQ